MVEFTHGWAKIGYPEGSIAIITGFKYDDCIQVEPLMGHHGAFHMDFVKLVKSKKINPNDFYKGA